MGNLPERNSLEIFYNWEIAACHILGRNARGERDMVCARHQPDMATGNNAL